jgi:hypothetical protein
MKYYNMKTLSYFLTLTTVLFLVACEDEDKIRIPEFPTAANMRLVVDPDHTQINYQTVATDYFAVDAYSENKDIDKVEITAQFQDDIRIMQTLHQSDFDDGHARIEFDANDFATVFGIPGFADASNGGNFAIRPIVYLTDGRIYPDYVVVSAQDSFLNVGTGPLGAANGAFTFRVNTAITCTPFDISGTYQVVSATGMSTDGCCPDETTVSGNIVEVVATSETVFSVSDITGGLYFEWYDVYGITSPDDSPGNLNFNCGEVTVVQTIEPFGTLVTGGGPYDGAAGRITYTWTNGFADSGTVILQKQ